MFKFFFAKTSEDRKFAYIFLAGLFLSFHYFLLAYINSTFLQNFIPDYLLGIVYALGATIQMIVLFKMPKIVKKIGNYNTIITLSVIEIAFLSIIAFSTSKYIILTAFIIRHSITPLLMVCLNVYLEDGSKVENVGKIRGGFLTTLALSAVIAPMITGSIVAESDGFKTIYLMSSFFMLLFLLTSWTNFKRKKGDDKQYKEIDTKKTMKEFLADKDIIRITIMGILLQFIFSWLVIYLPIYLHNEIGLTIEQIGILISMTLIPFVLLEIPLGELADTKYGEKEFLIAGMIISGLAFVSFGLTNTDSIILWGLIILIARVGASFIETSVESYFYKKVKGRDELISIFSLGSPIAYIIGPLTGSILLIFFDTKYLFMFLGILILLNIYIASKITDTM